MRAQLPVKSLSSVLAAVLVMLLIYVAQDTAQQQTKTDRPANEEGYYAQTAGKSGETLRTAIHDIISQHRKLTYRELWDTLAYTDEDPKNQDRVILLYTGRSQVKEHRDRGQNDPDAWNREHVWPKSQGFPKSSQAAYTDMQHIRPTDKSVNAERSNKNFDLGGNPIDEAPGARSNPYSFEPPGAVKGDVARMLFYMDVRYEGGEGVPDLALVTGNAIDKTPTFGNLCLLLEWHTTDPVSDWERRRNERVHEKQGNRNPFIDHPEWADELWSGQCG